MPVLDWLGKDKVINHHLDVPFRFLDKKFSVGSSQNKIIHGDNLLALKSLLPEFAGRVKCIYIDPPYNTGNENWTYNDAVNDPQIKRWLGNVVGSEDLSRHDKWLCMMYPRLRLLQKLLSDDGAIFISIDDNEQANLKLVCDEIFGAQNFRNVLSFRRYDKNINLQFVDNGLATLNVGLEYVMIYAKSNRFKMNPVYRQATDERSKQGYWKGFWNNADRPTMRYDLLGFCPESGQWKWKKELADEAVENYRVYLENYADKMSLEEYWAHTGKEKKFIRRNVSGKGKNKGVEHWVAPADGIMRNTNWSDMLVSKPTGVGISFDSPKNTDVIVELLKLATDKDSIVLDSFAGSGTTAHAVINLNAQDGGNRRFILIELMDYAETITAERVRRVGGSFDYYELGAELFDDDGFINAEIPREKIFDYVYFAETQKHYEPSDEENLLGVDEDTAYYFFDDAELNFDLLAKIRTRANSYVVYAANCTLAESEIDEFHITFKKIPRDVPRL